MRDKSILWHFTAAMISSIASVMTYGSENTLYKGENVSVLVSPDGQNLAYGMPAYSQDGECVTRLMVCKTDGTEQTAIKEVQVCNGEVLWLGENHLICTEMQSSCYTVVSLDGNTLADIVLPAGSDVLYKRISPDGRRTAYVGGVKQNGLFIVELNTGQIQCVIDKALRTAPAWSPDSRRLAIGNSAGYVRGHPLVIVNVDTNEVTATEINGVGASWSNDGRYLAFTTEVVRGGSWWYGIPADGRIGLLDVGTRQLTYVTPPARNISDKDTGKRDTEGCIQPVWSPDGNWIAYRKISYFQENKDAKSKQSDETWVVDKQGQEPRKVSDGCGPVAWGKDSSSLFILKATQLDCVDINTLNSQTLASWEKAKVPEPTPNDTVVIKKPGVVVEVTWIDKVYGEALASILSEARREYEETFGLSLPETITLQAKREPQGTTSLWTDGESYLFLTIESKNKLAPPARSGVFNIYGHYCPVERN